MSVRNALLVCFCVLGALATAEAAPGSDKTIERSIASTILNDPLMRRSRNINVKAENGIVYLWGTVDSLFDKMQAGLYAENAQGVTDVHNCLKVKFRWPWEDEACGNTCEDVIGQEKWW